MPEDDQHNRGHKYPFLAAEIFNCEINQILDKFFEAPQRPSVAVAEPTEGEKDNEPDDVFIIKKDDKKSDDEAEDEDKKEDSKSQEDDEATPESKEDEPAKKDENDVNPQGEQAPSETPAETPAAAEDKKEASEEAKPEAKEKAASEEKKEEEPAKTEPAEKNTQEPEAEEQKETPKDDEPNATPLEDTPDAAEKKDSASDSDEKEAMASEDKDTKAEPEEEAQTSINADVTDSAVASTVASTLATEANEDDDPDSQYKFMLLDRLFKFVRNEGELNPVLSGYFCKLVSLLISRKQKQLIPYIYGPDCDIIDSLLNHVYQKSVSEVLNKLLVQLDTDYDEEVLAQIKEKQAMAVNKLVEKLGPDSTEEDNLNASTILRDLVEKKEFFSVLCRKENMVKLVEYSTALLNESQKQSKLSSLLTLNQVIQNFIEFQKKKEQKKETSQDANDDDDVMIDAQNSDGENSDDGESDPNSPTFLCNQLVDLLVAKMETICDVLNPEHQPEAKLASSIDDEEFVPLGQQRLTTVEMVLKMLKLKKESLDGAMMKSVIFKNVIGLVKAYPWNNFLQLKVLDFSLDFVG